MVLYIHVRSAHGNSYDCTWYYKSMLCLLMALYIHVMSAHGIIHPCYVCHVMTAHGIIHPCYICSAHMYYISLLLEVLYSHAFCF